MHVEKDDVWTTGKGRNVQLEMSHGPCMAHFNVDSCDIKTAVLINLVPREWIKLYFLHHFGNPKADFSNLANNLSSSSWCVFYYTSKQQHWMHSCIQNVLQCVSVYSILAHPALRKLIKSTPYSLNSCIYIW